MRLTDREKDSDMFERLLRINDASFEVNERASREKLWTNFCSWDVFVDSTFTPGAFAIVTERDGPYLMIIAVQESLRGLGVGAALLKEVADFYTLGSEPYITLMCKVENWRAQRLYLKNGYRVLRVVPKYYGDEDGLMMRRILC